MPTSNAMLSVKEQWQAIEQLQVAKHNFSFKSIETPTSCDYVEVWISQRGNSLFFLPTTLSNLFSSSLVDLQHPPSIVDKLCPYLNKRCPPSLDKWLSLLNNDSAIGEWHSPAPSLDEWCPSLPQLTVSAEWYACLNRQLPPCLEERLPPSWMVSLLPSVNGVLPPSVNSVLPPLVNGVLPPFLMNGIHRTVSLPWWIAPSPPWRTATFLNDWLLDEQFLPSLVDEWLPPSINTVLPFLCSLSLIDEWHPSINGQHFCPLLMKYILPPSLMNGVHPPKEQLSWRTTLPLEEQLPPLINSILPKHSSLPRW